MPLLNGKPASAAGPRWPESSTVCEARFSTGTPTRNTGCCAPAEADGRDKRGSRSWQSRTEHQCARDGECAAIRPDRTRAAGETAAPQCCWRSREYLEQFSEWLRLVTQAPERGTHAVARLRV